MNAYISFLVGMAIHTPWCIECDASSIEHTAPLICQLAPLTDTKEHKMPDMIIYAGPLDLSPAEKEEIRFGERYRPVVEGYAQGLVDKVHKHWIAPAEKGKGSAVANIAINNAGKLLWIALDHWDNPDPGILAYNQALIHAIVDSVPLPNLPKGSPAKIIFRIPFLGPNADAIEPIPMEYKAKPNKPDWECELGMPNKKKRAPSIGN